MKRWVLGWLAALVFLAPLKFGTPVIIQSVLVPPADLVEWLVFLWPNQLLAVLACGALPWFWLDPHRPAARRDWLFWLPALFLLTQLAALPGAIYQQVAFDTVTLFAVGGLVFYAAAAYVRDDAAFVRLAGALGGAAILICLIALDQYVTGFADTAASLAAAPPEVAGKLAARRVFGTLVSPNALAGFLVVAIGPTLAWLWHRDWQRPVKWSVLALAAGLIVAVLVLTGSRGGVLALGVALFAVLARRRWWLIVAGLAVFVLVAQGSGRWRWSGESFAARLDYWQGAARIIRDHPWRGTGPGTFGSIYPAYKTAVTEEAQTVHNNFLQMWADSGVVAFVVFAALWVAGLRAAYRLARQQRTPAAWALVAALTGWVAHGLVDSDLYVPGVAIPAFALLGAAHGMQSPPGAPVGRRRWWALATVLVVVGAGRSLAATFPHGRARQSGDLAAAEEAVRRQPGNAQYRATAGDCALAAGAAARAVDHYRAAVALDPYRAARHWHLARTLWATGARAKSHEALRAAVRLNPTHPDYRRALADFPAP